MPFKVLINNFNRASCLARLVRWILDAGCASEIHIIDNNSSYPPTLALYEELASCARIHRLDTNGGPNAPLLVLSSVVKSGESFVASDPDVVPSDDCPRDLFEVMAHVLHDYDDVWKVGPALRLDSIPTTYPFARQVIAWESSLYGQPLPCFRGAKAAIDTTLAMYRSIESWGTLDQLHCVRLFRPYTAVHSDWHRTPDTIDEEYEFYLTTAKGWATYADRMRAFRIFESRLSAVRTLKASDERVFSNGWSAILLGRRYALRNLAHGSQTTLTFSAPGKCICWNLAGNQVEEIADKVILVSYDGGNYSQDLLTFSDDLGSFRGVSDRGWTICGSRID